MIGDRIRLLRIEKNMSQDDLAKLLDKSRPTITAYENNERQPDIDFLIKAAEYFNVSLDYIVGKSEFKNINEEMKYTHFNNSGILDFLSDKDKSELTNILNLFFTDVAELYELKPGFINTIMTQLLGLNLMISHYLNFYSLTPDITTNNIREFMESKGYAGKLSTENINKAILKDLGDRLTEDKKNIESNIKTFMFLLIDHLLETKCPDIYPFLYIDKLDGIEEN